MSQAHLPAPQQPFSSGIRDNHGSGTVADFLGKHLVPGAPLDFVTAYFTVFAYDSLALLRQPRLAVVPAAAEDWNVILSLNSQ